VTLLPGSTCRGRNVIQQMVEAVIAQARCFQRPLAEFLIQVLLEEGLELDIFIAGGKQDTGSQQTTEQCQHQVAEHVFHLLTPKESPSLARFEVALFWALLPRTKGGSFPAAKLGRLRHSTIPVFSRAEEGASPWSSCKMHCPDSRAFSSRWV